MENRVGFLLEGLFYALQVLFLPESMASLCNINLSLWSLQDHLDILQEKFEAM